MDGMILPFPRPPERSAERSMGRSMGHSSASQESGPGYPAGTEGDEMMLVTLKLGQQLCGVPVQRVTEVLNAPKITPIPLSSADISGCLNLRGRVVTAIDTRICVSLPPMAEAGMALVTERGGELFALVGDEVADVMSLPADMLEPCPPTLAETWARYSTGVCRLADRLLVVLDVDTLVGGLAL
jgi:purine-binding chemotaxis protein CheW